MPETLRARARVDAASTGTMTGRSSTTSCGRRSLNLSTTSHRALSRSRAAARWPSRRRRTTARATTAMMSRGKKGTARSILAPIGSRARASQHGQDLPVCDRHLINYVCVYYRLVVKCRFDYNKDCIEVVPEKVEKNTCTSAVIIADSSTTCSSRRSTKAFMFYPILLTQHQRNPLIIIFISVASLHAVR